MSPFLTHRTCSEFNYTLFNLQNNSFFMFLSRMYFDIRGKKVFTLMCCRLKTLIKASLPYFPVVLIKSTNYFHASISRLSFDAWKVLKKKKGDRLWESYERTDILWSQLKNFLTSVHLTFVLTSLVSGLFWISAMCHVGSSCQNPFSLYSS